jgi:hypothetical protein
MENTRRALMRPISTFGGASRARARAERVLEPSFALAAAKYLPGARGRRDLIRDGARLTGLVPGRVEGFASGRPIATFVGWTHPYARFRRRCSIARRRKKPSAACCALPSFPGSRDSFSSVRERGWRGGALSCRRTRAQGNFRRRFDPHQRAMLQPAAGSHPLRSRFPWWSPA